MDFRPLFDEIFDCRAPRPARSLYYDLLAPWLNANPEHVAWLKEFRSRPGSPVPSATAEDLWDLYSISRVNELLLAVLQEPPVVVSSDRWTDDEGTFRDRAERWNLTLTQYCDFMRALGFALREEPTFTPVLHEIVQVDQHTEARHPITLVGEFWPALMLGDMVFSRAGVLVEGGAARISKQIAECSALFWSWLRRYRPTRDLSMGWGSNSQWRTHFRRDYIVSDLAYLNVDPTGPYPGSDGLNEEQHRELLLHRCFIISHPVGSAVNFWPYDQTAVVSFP